MTEVKLLGGGGLSPFARRVEWVLKLKGVKYECIEEDLKNKSSLLLQSNPVYKKIPVLLHAGKAIAESVIIVEYIEETWRENPILPEDAYERARARFWAKYGEEKCLLAVREFFLSVGKDQEKALEQIIESLKTLEEHGLEKKRYFGGETIGFVDIVLGWIPHWLPVFEEIAGIKILEPHSFPILHAWVENFLSHPIIRENLPSHDEMFPHYKARREKSLAPTAYK